MIEISIHVGEGNKEKYSWKCNDAWMHDLASWNVLW